MKSLEILMLLLVSQFLIGQDSWENFTNNYSVTDVIEVEDGFWLSSTGGLCFVDSISNEQSYLNRGNSDIPSNSINDMLLHPDGKIWMTSGCGLSVMENQEFESGPEALTGILKLTPDNKIVVANYDSLYIQTDGMNFEAIDYPNFQATINGVEIDSSGIIYVNVINYFAESFVAAYKDNEWEIIFSEFIYESAITLDHENRLWLLFSEGLHYFDDGIWVMEPEAGTFDAFGIRQLYTDIDNNILIEINEECPRLSKWDGTTLQEIDFVKDTCTDCQFLGVSKNQSDHYFSANIRNGFYNFSSVNIGEYQAYSQSPLLFNIVNTTLHPTDGSHIVVYYDRIQKIENGDWSEISVPSSLSSLIRFAGVDSEDVIWISTDEELWKYENESWSNQSLPSEISENINRMVVGENGDVWIQSSLNIARLRNGEWENYRAIHHDITSSIIKDLQVDSENGDLWVSTFQGIRHFDGFTWTRYDMPSSNQTFSLAIANDRVYIRTGSLYSIKDGIVELESFPEEGYYGPFESSMFFDRESDKLYLAGAGILAILENEEWRTFTPKNSGIFNSRANDIKVDGIGNIWLSGGGLSIYNESGVILSNLYDVFFDVNFEVQVFPNLLRSDQIAINSNQSGLYGLYISDALGHLIKAEKVELQANQSKIYKLPNSNQNMLFISFEYKGKIITKSLFKVQ